ncbi:hypothetical protein PIB30_082831 [Stylosanthes scabra]|uniref:Uncharacterized protein n=1 Tax=Stylosanthes scabra TaxID=79078 RepID=A0ABU6URJ1_9FABA|nr:hypothetical protein [Stylosanthes scabra]
MAPRGRSRTRGGGRSGEQPAAAPEANPQDPEGLYRVNDEWHIAGALAERRVAHRRRPVRGRKSEKWSLLSSTRWDSLKGFPLYIALIKYTFISLEPRIKVEEGGTLERSFMRATTQKSTITEFATRYMTGCVPDSLQECMGTSNSTPHFVDLPRRIAELHENLFEDVNISRGNSFGQYGMILRVGLVEVRFIQRSKTGNGWTKRRESGVCESLYPEKSLLGKPNEEWENYAKTGMKLDILLVEVERNLTAMRSCERKIEGTFGKR